MGEIGPIVRQSKRWSDPTQFGDVFICCAAVWLYESKTSIHNTAPNNIDSQCAISSPSLPYPFSQGRLCAVKLHVVACKVQFVAWQPGVTVRPQ